MIIPIQLFNTYQKNIDFSTFKFNYDAQLYINKPQIAFWTSPLKEENNVPTSPWIHWCWQQHFRIYNYAYILYPKTSINIFTINSLNDINKLPLIIQDNWCSIDFNRLQSLGYDGIYLSEYAAHYLRRNIIDNKIISFDTWDVESICWFNANWIDKYQIISSYIKKLRNSRRKKDMFKI